MSLKIEQILGPGDKEPIPKDWRLLGFFDSPETHSKISLLAAAMGLDKSKLLRKIVSDWLAEHDAVTWAQKKIRELKTSPEGSEIPLKEFKARIRAFLEEKKVESALIEKVLKEIK